MSKTILEQMTAFRNDDPAPKQGETFSLTVDVLILTEAAAHRLKSRFKGESFAVKTLVVADSMPFTALDHRMIGEWVSAAGGIYLPSGRTGNPSPVAAEDGLVVPGSVLAGDDDNILELGVLGAFISKLNDDELLTCLETGQIDMVFPAVQKLELTEKPGEWINGFDIALHILSYFDLPEKEVCLEITGEAFGDLSLEERFSMARTLVDMGHKRVIFEADQKVMAYLQDRTVEEGQFFFNETEDAVLKVDLSKVDSMALVKENDTVSIKSLIDLDEKVVDLVVAGGDSGCRFEDFKVPLTLTRYREMNAMTSCFCLPGSELILGDLLDMGLAGLLSEMGAQLLPASMLPVLASHTAEEKSIMATSLKMAEKGAVTAGSISCFCAAMAGKIIHPREFEMLVKETEEDHEQHD